MSHLSAGNNFTLNIRFMEILSWGRHLSSYRIGFMHTSLLSAPNWLGILSIFSSSVYSGNVAFKTKTAFSKLVNKLRCYHANFHSAGPPVYNTCLLILFISFCSWFRTIGAFAHSMKLAKFSSEWVQSILHVVAPKYFANAAWLEAPQQLLHFMFMDQWPGTLISLRGVLKYWKVAVFTLCSCHWTSGTIKCCLNYGFVKSVRLLLRVCQGYWLEISNLILALPQSLFSSCVLFSESVLPVGLCFTLQSLFSWFIALNLVQNNLVV